MTLATSHNQNINNQKAILLWAANCHTDNVLI